MKLKSIFILFLTVCLMCSCESEQKKQARIDFENELLTNAKQKEAEQKKAAIFKLEQEQIAAEEEKKQNEINNKYINNTLATGSTPYSRYYGGNSTCTSYGCSQIKVRTSNSDVLVTLKKAEKVVRHAFIQAGDEYTFSFPNGSYQAFFYYGKGWNPEKEMKNGEIKGGFISNEDFGKDEPQLLHNNVLEYELILQQNGNFSTQPSNPDEAL